MKFSLSWLNRHIKLDTGMTLGHIENILSTSGFEVESIHNKGELYENFIVAQIISAEKHPNADKLKVCKVSDGNAVHEIVCGAFNARAGIKVILAKPGAILPHSKIEIKKSKIRGVSSAGMLCSKCELGLTEDIQDGIMEVENNVENGTSLAKYINEDDVIFDIALTPNRGDAASILGIAREINASSLIPLQNTFCQNNLLQDAVKKINAISPGDIKIECKQSCTEMRLLYVSGVKKKKNLTGESDIINKLKSIGESLHDNLMVNISNFVMLDIGRPNHIYDADKIDGEIFITKSKKGEIFEDLLGNKHILDKDLLIIKDQAQIISIAGVIGSCNTKVTAETKNIIIEVGNFHQSEVIKSVRSLGISTNASFRFERNVDFANGEFALQYLASLIMQNYDGEISNHFSYCKFPDIEKINFNLQNIEKISGFKVKKERALQILNKLGFECIVSASSEVIQVITPSWRIHDVQNSSDLVEEILRIEGPCNIPSIRLPDIKNPHIKQNSNITNINIINKLRTRLTHIGYREVITWSFCKPELSEISFLDQKAQILQIQNPISSDLSFMRRSIFSSMIPILQENFARSEDSISIFETGSIYAKLDTKLQKQYSYRSYYNQDEEIDIVQIPMICGLNSGISQEKGVHNNKERIYDFFDIKASVLSILAECNIKEHDVSFQCADLPNHYHAGKGAAIYFKNMLIGYCGEMHPKLLLNLKIQNAVGFELLINALTQLYDKHNKKVHRSNYQAIKRDLAFLVPKNIEASSIICAIQELNIKELIDIRIFDVYEDSSMKEEKSIAIRLKLQSADKTMKEGEISSIINSIVKNVSQNLHATCRM